MIAFTAHDLVVLDIVLTVLVLTGVVGLFLVPASPGHDEHAALDRWERKRRNSDV